jgi:hypothetical protein
MIIEVGTFNFELPDEWIEEAGFAPFGHQKDHYRFDRSSFSKDVITIEIRNIAPTIRGKGVPIFKDGEVDGRKLTARQRVVPILKAIQQGYSLPPVSIVDVKQRTEYRYKLVHGCHRLHCSIAAGFPQIPAVYGININDPDF